MFDGRGFCRVGKAGESVRLDGMFSGRGALG